jgi:hypothetical protein
VRIGSAFLLAGATAQSQAAGATGTIMLVVANSGSLVAQETARKTMMEGWGYTVVPISATAWQGTFDTAALTSSCAYICETVTSTDLGTKLKAKTMPVICDESALTDDLGISSGYTQYTATSVYITNTSHYITSGFSSGWLSIFSSSQPLHYTSGTLGSFTTLAKQSSWSGPTLVVMERGDSLYSSGSAAGRRVYLPWGGSGMDFTQLSSDGQTMLRRTIEWALMPVCWWKLDDGSGSTAVDSTGGRNGSLNGASWTTGKVSGALSFDGSSDYVTISNNSVFQVTGALTIAAWVYGASWSSDPNYASVILRKGDANPNNWQLAINQGYVSLTLDDSDGSSINGSTHLANNKWYHVAGTWDGSKGRVYVNGSLDNTPVSHTSSLGTDTRPVYLGGRTGTTDVLNGRLDDVRFYNRCLTAAEIAALASSSPTITSWENVAP